MIDVLLSLDQTVITLGAVMAAVLVLSLVLYAVAVARFSTRSRFKKRLATVAGKPAGRAGARANPDGSRRKDIQEKLKNMEEGQRAKKRRRHQIRHDIQQAGLDITVRQFAIGSVALGLGGLVLMMILDFHIVVGLLVGLAMGLGAPKYALKHMRKRRLKAFTTQFADAIDVIVRGIQSGLPVGECLTIIARESPEPIAGEFRQIVESIHFGRTLEESLARALERVPLADLNFFAIVLQIQQQTGGNLAETLSNLSGVLRDRKKMKAKVAAMAAEANTSAAIIGALPFVVTLALVLINPDYVGILFEDEIGKIMVAVGLTWMSIGVFIMKQMINFEI